MPLQLTINGLDRTFDSLAAGSTVADVVVELGLQADRVAVERNGEIAPRASWGTARLNLGDRLEVVHFVGGG
jgi:sulfur carrier protein